MESIDLIKTYLLIHGHSLDYETPSIDEQMAHYILDLSALEYTPPETSLTRLKRKQVRSTAQAFYDAYFKLHNILYCTDRMVKKINRKPISTYEEALTYFNELGKSISPYNLPVHFSEAKETNGVLSMLYIDIDDENFLSQMKPYFKYIALIKKPTILTPPSYIHELCHLELESNKCSIVDCNNSEAFPIFLELISLIDNEELFRYTLNKRIEFLIEEFNNLISFCMESKGTIYDAFNYNKYIISLIKAFNLLLLYLNSNTSQKKEILSLIQQTFDAKRTVEEVLSKLEITKDNSLDINIIKKLMKVR